MAYVMFQYDRPTESHRWNDYNQQVREWIAQLLQIPGAVSFMAYRTTDGASPNTITMLEFHTVEDARKAQGSEQMQRVLDGLRAVGVTARVLLVERSPFTPEPFQA
jgi:quinol monooxygenase YgiN